MSVSMLEAEAKNFNNPAYEAGKQPTTNGKATVISASNGKNEVS